MRLVQAVATWLFLFTGPATFAQQKNALNAYDEGSIIFIKNAAKEHNDKPLPPEIAKAWRDAGFEVGWMKDVPPRSPSWGFWRPWREKSERGAIPAFGLPEKEAGGVLAKLPDPGTPFGLDFHCGPDAGVTLKEFAKLKNLQSLNLKTAGVTATGVAAMQKDLPECKIEADTDDDEPDLTPQACKKALLDMMRLKPGQALGFFEKKTRGRNGESARREEEERISLDRRLSVLSLEKEFRAFRGAGRWFPAPSPSPEGVFDSPARV
jgi:hypothetical protein